MYAEETLDILLFISCKKNFPQPRLNLTIKIRPSSDFSEPGLENSFENKFKCCISGKMNALPL